MGMSTGVSADGGATPNINVTPLIDVLLVLLIIFMVIAPVKPHQFEAKVPAEPKDQPPDVEIKPNPLTLVISINKDDLSVKLNNESMGNTSDTKPLEDRLTAIFNDRRSKGSEFFREGTNEVERTIFIKSPKGVKYGEVVKIIDAAKLSGAQPIGLQIDDLSD